MDLQADSVAESVGEEGPETGGLDDTARRSVDTGDVGPCLGSIDTGLLSRQHMLVDLRLPWLRFSANDDGSGHVGVVAGAFGASIDDDEVSDAQGSRCRLMVRNRRIRA